MWVFWVIAAVIAIGLIVIGIDAASRGKENREKEAKRTCRRCGAVWFLSAQEAREQPPTSGDMAAAKVYRAGKRATVFPSTKAAAGEMAVHNLEAKAERVSARRSCPQCGSQSYDQELVPIGR